MNLEEKTEEYSLDSKGNAFLGSEQSAAPSSIKRNDPCFCQSGLKYKKCCLKKQERFKDIRFESIKIKFEPLTKEESKCDFQSISKEDTELMTTLYCNLHEHPETIDSENCEFFQKLNDLRAKYPENPTILNHLAGGYQLLGLKDQANAINALTYEKFPDYLFARLAQANLYLRDGFPEKAHAVFEKAHSLKQLYPDRTVFHVSEFRAFEVFMVQYHVATRNIEQAERHLSIMQEIFEDDDPLLQDLNQVVYRAKTLQTFNKHTFSK